MCYAGGYLSSADAVLRDLTFFLFDFTKFTDMKVWFPLLVSFLLALAATAKYDTHFVILSIQTTDNVTLSADGMIPKPKTPGEKFPAVIFPNSWGIPQIEYITKVLHLADNGYVAIEYETRGWYSSGGEIDTAGPLDRQDTKSVFDYVVSKADEWNVNVTRIAFCGISYGAGLSLMAAGHIPQLRTAIAMSGWDRFVDGFYYYKTPAAKELHGLLDIGKKHGRVPAQLNNFYDWISTHTNMTAVHHFAHERSPESLYLEDYNTRGTPIFLSNNMLDRLFFPQTKTHFYSRITGPKFQLINKGSHAEPEALGIADLGHNYIWEKVFKWMDYWLKDIDNGIMDEPPIQVQCGTSIAAKNYTKFTAWPDPVKSNPMNLYFTGRGSAQYGGLQSQPEPTSVVDTITYDGQPKLNEGNDKDSSLGFPSQFTFSQDAPVNSTIVYLSAAFAADTEVCGVPSANLTLSVPSDGNWQIYAFMYDVQNGVGSIIGDGMYTSWGDSNGEGKAPLQATIEKLGSRGGTTQVRITNLELRVICRVIEAGHQFGVAFLLSNPGYTPAATDGLNVGFHYNEDTVFVLPRVVN